MGHDHHHAPKDFGRAFAIGIFLNGGFIVLEVVFGLLSDSLALLADAGHNMSDVLGLILAWGASELAKKAASSRRTYGWKRATVLAALFNALLLLVGVGGIFWEAIRRLQEPAQVAGATVIWVAGARHFGQRGDSMVIFFREKIRPQRARCVFAHGGGCRSVSGCDDRRGVDFVHKLDVA